MPEYFTPGVYIEDVPSVAPMSGVGSFISGFVGVAKRGKVNEPTFITSWNAYIDKFSKGLPTAFDSNSDLSYAVYGFFQNGGTMCYVTRAAHETAAMAVCSLSNVVPDEGLETLNEEDENITPDTPTGEEGGGETPETPETPEVSPILITAKDEGAWANSMTLSILEDEWSSGNFVIAITLNGEIVERMDDLSNEEGSNRYWVDVVNSSSAFIKAMSGTLVVTDEATFSGGADGIEDITDTDFVEAVKMFDTVDDVMMIAVPGQTSAAVIKGVTAYVNERKYIFCALDSPETSTVDSVLTLRKSISCIAGELLFPWIKVVDPLSSTGKLRNCPPSGHVLGVISRMIAQRGVWRTPAGTEAVIQGAIETTVYLPQGETDRLNPAGVVSILPKANSGIVVWGARSLSTDSTMRYISDILLDIYIKKTAYNSTQQFVFEPNSEETWRRVRVMVESFLDTLWRDGGLYGSTASQAYYVKCDETTNPESSRKLGRMITEVGYASKKPSEFVIFRFSHEVYQN